MAYEVIEVTLFKISVNLTSKASASAASEVIDVTFANILVKSPEAIFWCELSSRQKYMKILARFARIIFVHCAMYSVALEFMVWKENPSYAYKAQTLSILSFTVFENHPKCRNFGIFHQFLSNSKMTFW